MGGPENSERRPLSRRKFLAISGAVAALPLLLEACGSSGSGSSAGGTAAGGTTGSTAGSTAGGGSSGGGGTSSGTLGMWDGELGNGQFNTLSKKLVENWRDGKFKATYDLLTGNIYEVIETALASGKGPQIAGGYAYQAFQYADQGYILYSDNVVETMKKNGTYDDYLPGMFSPLKVSGGYVGLPWGVDTRALWYNKKLLAKAGAAVPTDWNSFLAAAKALKKIGVYGYVTSANSTNSAYGTHTIATLMINNGGGIFDPAGNVDATYDRNVEAMEFLRELAVDGLVDPGSVSYTDTDVYTQLKNGHAAMALANASIPEETGMSAKTGDLVVMSPIAGPHGDKGTIQYLKNYQMYKSTPSVAASEDFMLWWLDQFAGKNGFFAKGVTGTVPIRKSVIALPAIQSDPQLAKIIKEWVPIAKPESARCPHIFAGLATVDNGTAMIQLAQEMLQGKTPAQTALKTFQAAIQQYGASYKQT